MSQGKYSKITQPSLFYIQVCNNHGIQKPQLWSNDKDQCIKISFSFSLEIIPHSLLPMHMSCVHARSGEQRCCSRCWPWWGSWLGRQRCSATAWSWSALGHSPPSSHKPSLSPVKSFLTFISVAP